VERLAPDGTTVVQASIAIGTGSSRSLRWENSSATDVDDEYVRVQSGECTTTCGSKDVYRIRAFETTYTLPRFNNTGSQITVLVVQNPASYPVNGHVWFWDFGGALLGSAPLALGAKQTIVLNTVSVVGVAGQGGTITVSNNGRYGDLSGKTVALEPATGLSFDTPMLPRPSSPAVQANGTCQGKADSRSCYAGPPGTSGVGVCRAGIQPCVNGAYDGACVGDILPSAEACNGLDDDCNGAIDDGLGAVTCGLGACQQTVPACTGGTPGTCVPGLPGIETCDGVDNDCDGAIDEDGCPCVFVSPAGNDQNPGTGPLPKRTIAAALAAAGTGGLPAQVCVASGPTCPSQFDYPEIVTMRNGIHLYGGYQDTGAPTWPRDPTCETRIVAQDSRGIFFGAVIADATIVDGFTIRTPALPQPTAAALTVQGSEGAIINNNVIIAAALSVAYGVDIVDDLGVRAHPILTGNAITGQGGMVLSAGVRSLNSAPVIRGSCSAFDAAGRCANSCGVATRFIRGGPVGPFAGAVYGVLLENSPGTLLEQNSICGSANAFSGAAAVRLFGDGAGVRVRANYLESGGYLDAVGFWTDPCAGAAPRIVDNFLILGGGTSGGGRSDGIRAVGDCHPAIEHNLNIMGVDHTIGGNPTGVVCARDGSGVASRCTILANALIQGSSAGSSSSATGVRCEDGACARIEHNSITGGNGSVTVGLMLGRGDTYVDSNVLAAGCAASEGRGLFTMDSSARLQNNQIFGADSACSQSGANSYAARVVLGEGANEIDLHSNDLFGEGVSGGACISRGLAWEDIPGAAPPGPRGLVRNNIVFGGRCSQSFTVDEASPTADPRVLLNNDLWRDQPTTVLYRDEAMTNLFDIAAVNALGDITAAGNISADPLYVAGHIAAGSPCRNAGTATAGPLWDFEGDGRPQESIWDIGRDEFVP
jgi:hypothetical protein